MANTKSLDGKVIIVTGAGRGIGREIALLCRRGRRQGRRQRSGRRRRRLRVQPPHRPRKWSRKSRSAAARLPPTFESVAEAIPASKIVQAGCRHLRPTRRRREQCRHPARRDLPSHEHRSLRAGHQGSPDGLVLCRARRRTHFPRAGKRQLRPLHLDLRPDRQFRTGELRGGQARHRRSLEVDRARHGAIQRALELHLAVRLEPHDRNHSDRDARRGAARVAKIKRWKRGQDRPVVAYLSSDASPRTSPARSSACVNEIFLMGQSGRSARCIVAKAGRPRRSPSTAMPALKSSFYKLDRSGDIFTWDPI
jgi:hypothetical protein